MADIEEVKKNLRAVLSGLTHEEQRKFLAELIYWLKTEYNSLDGKKEMTTETEEEFFDKYAGY